MTAPKPVVLCILDGWGLSNDTRANAPYLAETPTFDAIMSKGPHATLITHGPDVGLPSGQMGNSEVGHTNIGAGRIVAMDLGQIDLAIEDGSFFDNAALQDFISKVKAANGTAHLMGLISDGGVHGHLNHIIAAAKAITDAGVPVALHAMTDGRDVSPKSAFTYVAQLEERLPKNAKIVTVSGRYFAMDRDNRWERVSEAYDAMINAKGREGQDRSLCSGPCVQSVGNRRVHHAHSAEQAMTVLRMGTVSSASISGPTAPVKSCVPLASRDLQISIPASGHACLRC